MNSAGPTQERLQDRVKRWRDALAASDTGPLVIAADVMALANEWEIYRAEADGASCTTWLRKTLGKGRGVPWFDVRARAVQKLGESVRRTLHHHVAVWLVNGAPESNWKACVEALTFARKKNGGNALTLVQAKIVVRPILGKSARPVKVACDRCAKLEAVLKANGIEMGVSGAAEANASNGERATET